MRIGFDVSQTGRHKRGCGYFADSLARELTALDRDNTYVLYPTFGSAFWDPDWRRGTLQLRDRPNVVRADGQRRLDELETFWSEDVGELDSRIGSPDIVHSNNFFCPTRLSRARLVYTLHDLAFLSHPEWTSEANWRVCFDGVFKASLYADHVVAVSSFTRRQFLQMFPHVPADRVSVVYEASRFDQPRGGPPPASVTGLRSGQFWLALGTDDPRKNLPRLVQAHARLLARGEATYPLVVYGGGGPSSPAVRRLGYVDDATLRWLYENCFAFCYPSLFEGFGLPLVEAMCLGAPVLTSNVTALPEVVGEAGVLVDPVDVDAIYAGLRRLATDESARSTLRARGLRRAAHFSWRGAAARVRDVYAALASEYPRLKPEREPVGFRPAQT